MMAQQERSERRYRWTEIALTLTGSVVTSAAAIVWVLGSTLSEIKTRQAEAERRLEQLERVPSMAVDLASLKARQDGDDQNRVQLDARLQRIEAKLDRILEVRR